VFPNITQPYCDAASARVGDMLLPTDDRNFAIEATPIPDLFEGLKLPENIKEGEAVVQAPGGQMVDLLKAKEAFDAMLQEAERRADKAEQRVDDWLQECQYHSHLRMVIDDCSQIGSGVIKGPSPIKRKSRMWKKDETGAYQLILKEEIKPASLRIDPWNFYPDPACGECIHNGAYVFERDMMTGKRLEDFIGMKGYITSEIEKCLAEGPASVKESDQRNLNTEAARKSQFEVWHYYGSVTAGELRAAGVDVGDAPENKSFPAMIDMVNDRVIRASLNPLDTGEFPYDVIPWKRRPGMPWGMGVARQMRYAQRMLTAAARNLMDNAGLAAGPQIVLRRGVDPADGVIEIVPRKVWVESDEADGGNPAPLLAVTIPMILPELRAIIQLAMEFAERVTGLPMLLQGQQGVAPDTATGMSIMNNNASSLLRRVARLFDSCVTEPHIRRYYAWLMEYGEDDEAKGDFQIVARGSTALVERDLQAQEMLGLVQLCLNPAYGKSPAKAMDELLKSRRFDPATFDYTEEEKKQMQEQAQAQQQPMPQIEVAKIREDGANQRKQMELEAEQTKLQHESNENALDRELERMSLEIDAQLAVQGVSSEDKRAFEKIKADLAGLTIKVKAQKDMRATQILTPPTEPAGRAPDGQAFER
jgi:hypothetical protein